MSKALHSSRIVERKGGAKKRSIRRQLAYFDLDLLLDRVLNDIGNVDLLLEVRDRFLIFANLLQKLLLSLLPKFNPVLPIDAFLALTRLRSQLD